MGFENNFNGICFYHHFKFKLVSNLCKNFLCIAWHQKPTVRVSTVWDSRTCNLDIFMTLCFNDNIWVVEFWCLYKWEVIDLSVVKYYRVPDTSYMKHLSPKTGSTGTHHAALTARCAACEREFGRWVSLLASGPYVLHLPWCNLEFGPCQTIAMKFR